MLNGVTLSISLPSINHSIRLVYSLQGIYVSHSRGDRASIVKSAVHIGFRPIQNGHETIRFYYGLVRLFNGLIQLRVIVYENMNRLGTVYKLTDLAINSSYF